MVNNNTMIVYMAKNKINQKCYIGITKKTLEYRKLAHEKASKYNKRKFSIALKKYGFDNFEWRVLDSASSIDELELKEVYYISKYDSVKNGYNLTSGGEIKKEYSEESKQKMKEARVEWHTKNTNGFKGKTHKKEVRRKLSQNAIGRISPNKDKQLSDVHKNNLSKAQKEWLKNNTHPNLGKTWKHSKKRDYKQVTCIYCGKVGKGPNMNRYHFSNCKSVTSIT
jgi:group I intron endonuclease